MIQNAGNEFVAGWAAHGQKLFASVKVMHGHFIVISLDEKQAAASGCSIDKSVQWIRKTGEQIGVDLLDRQSVAWIDDNQTIKVSPQDEFEALAGGHQIGDDTLVFNNLIFTGLELRTGWIVPARESWHSRYFTLV
jgi:hypothetical protein